MYLSGEAEVWVGDAIEGRRNDLFLASKVLPQNASQRGAIEACKGSLARLQTDYLDCYLLHWRGSIPLEETISGFEKLEIGGRILSWGVSNFDIQDIREAEAVLRQYPTYDQVLYHLKERAIAHEVIPFCELHHNCSPQPVRSRRFPRPRHSSGTRV